MLFAALAAAAALPAVSAPPIQGECLTYDRAYTAAPLMTIKTGLPGGRVYLQDKAQPCAPGKTCAFVRKAYVLPGDTVLASQARNGFRCVYVGGAGRLSAGFVPDAALAPAPPYAPLDAAFLVGRWTDNDDHLTFKLAKGKLVVDGDAVWPSAKPPKGVPESRFAPNIGEVEGAVRLAGPRFEVGDVEEACRVWGYRRGPYLIVDDNGNCGGMNVRFSGVYLRTPGR
jgi:hypothetical protein